MTTTSAFIPEVRFMRRALELAVRGQGRVEPNPMVGCVVVRQGRIVAEGWHDQYGGPHAEVAALAQARDQAGQSDLYVTLEPCNHHGQQPPCVDAILAAGVARVAAAVRDPWPREADREGQGIQRLLAEGVQVHVGLESDAALEVMAPFWKLVTRGRPWVIGKWAMTLDGKIAAATGESRWISGAASREVVHRLRGRMDAILVGSGTALADDPLLTARPAGTRVAMRIVADGHARLEPTCQLLRSTKEAPVLLAVGPDAPPDRVERLRQAGAEIWRDEQADPNLRLLALLDELGRRQVTNLLVEGGGHLLGALRDLGELDEVHVWVAPRLLGGADAPGPLGGRGAIGIDQAWDLRDPAIERCGPDVYIQGRTRRPVAPRSQPPPGAA